MDPKLRIVDRPTALDFVWGDLPLMSYVFGARPEAWECVKPFVHPIRTLAGDVVTGFRPRDHRWHTGLFLGFSKIADQDFWGGPTWVPGQDWVQLDNVGSIRHTGWESLDARDGAARVVEALDWRTVAGELWLTERRVLEVGHVDPLSRTWELQVEFALRNVSSRWLPLGHPASSGLEGFAYGGLTWRGPRAFQGFHPHDCVFFTADREGEAVHGSHAPWLAFVGEHDEHDRRSTLVFVDDARNPRHPTGWSVWTDQMVQVSCVFHSDGEYVIERGEELRLRYTVVIADGAWSRDDVERYLSARSLVTRST
jgi:hypothetical protein